MGKSKEIAELGNAVSVSDNDVSISGDLTVDTNTLFVDSTNNNVGIGTTSIDYNAAGRTVVHVEGSAGALLAMEDTGAKSYFFQTGDDLLLENDTASGSMIFGTNNSTERMRITSTGSVGIGTNSPTYKFEISDGARTAIINPNSSLDAVFIGTKESKPLILGTNDAERMRIDSVGRVTMPYQPAFHACGSTPTTSGNFLVYQTANFNIGNHYNTSTGIFTAPVNGTYLLGWTAIGNNTNDVYRYFMYVNGSKISNGDLHLRIDTTATGTEYGTNGMYTIPWYLSANDTVRISFESDSGSSQHGGGGATNDYTRFWGYLLG